MADDERALAARGGRSLRLIGALPELASAIPAEDRELAQRALVVPAIEVTDDDLAASMAAVPEDVFDFLVLDGLVLKETTFASRSALELLGPGDVLAPPLTAARQTESRALSRYVAHGTVSLAALDGRFRQAARRWPGLSDALHERLGRQTHRASMHMAMLHLTRVEDRIVALFVDLAERFGRVTADGVLIDVAVTHELIGGLVGSRRPTVSLALQALDAQGMLERTPDKRWLLAQRALYS